MSIFTNSKNKQSFNNNYNTPEQLKFDRSGYSFNPNEEKTLNKIKIIYY